MLGNMVFEDMSEILESLSIGVLIVDRRDRVTFANKKAFALTGLYYEDVISEFLSRVIDQEPLLSAVEGVLNGVMDRVPVEFRLNKREIRATSYKIGNGDEDTLAVLITLEDLSKFQELVDLKTEFISSLLHSLRTPMTTIKGGMSYLSAGQVKETTDSFFKEIVDMCSGEVNRLVEFLDDMRDLLLIEAGLAEHDLDQKFEDAVELIHTAIHNVSDMAHRKNIDIQFDFKDEKVMIECDPRRFILSLRKILENAVIFSPNDAHVTVTMTADSERLNLDIVDTGIGIPASEIEYIFDKHFRGKNDVTQKVTGNGLGLYIARYYIELMKGSILVMSGKGRGTHVKIAFNRE